MNNLKSYTEYAVTTPTTDFVIGFDFNYGTDAVNITVDDVPATEAGYTVIYLNSTTMRLNPAVPSGVVRLQRETDIDVPDNQFTAGAKFITSNMDENFTQIRKSQQEVRDGFEKLSEDTYEIIDTLQVVGQAAQDAADAAEQAAQTANDAAAQVNDKVAKSATLPTYITVADGVDPVTGVAAGAYFNVRSSSGDSYVDEYQNIGGSAIATGKSYPSSNALNNIPHNNLKDRDIAGAHPASAIVDSNGIDQQTWNTGLGSILELLSIENPVNGSRQFIKGLQGGWFEYNSSKSALNDGGTIFNGWVRVHYLNNAANLSWFGLIPEDISKATQNEPLLIKAIKYGNIIVDGFYYTACTTVNRLETSFSLTALNNDCGLHFTSTTNHWVHLMNVPNLELKGLKLRASSGLVGAVFTTNDAVSLIDSFNIIDCDIDVGDMFIFYSAFSTTVDPTVTRYGINKITIERNKIANARTLFVGTNCAHDLISIKHNRSRNISGQLFSFGISNEHTFTQKMQESMRGAYSAFNFTINDDDFFVSAPSTYLCSLLYEGDYLEYTWNHVEGLKTRVKASVYDVYVGSRELHYYHNTWKNNLCINNTKENGDLMKSKGTPISYYKYNRFIVEKSFVERHNANQDGMPWVTLFQKTYGDDSSNMVIHDNEIDVYELYNQPASNFIKNLDMRRNKIKAYRSAGQLIHANNTSPNVTNYNDASIVIDDNEIIIENAGVTLYRNGASVNAFNILQFNSNLTNGKGIPKQAMVSRNRVDIQNLHSLSELMPNPVASIAELSANTVRVRNNVSSTAFRSLESTAFNNATKRITKDNTLHGDVGVLGLNTMLPSDLDSKYTSEVNGSYNGWYCHVGSPTTNNLLVVVTLAALSPSGKFSATYNLKLTPTGIDYVDSAGVSQTLAYSATTAYTYVGPKVEKLNPLDTIMAGVQVGLRNSGNSSGSLRINLSSSSFTVGQNIKFKFSVETLVA